MVDQLQMFKGEHNFNSFRSSSCNSNNPIKKISFVELKTFNSFIIITVTANAFLHNMVRIMIGTIIDIAKNEIELSIKEIIEPYIIPTFWIINRESIYIISTKTINLVI